MLFLSRKVGESVLIANGIKVTIVNIRGNLVNIGIEADKGIRILREELLDKPFDDNDGPKAA